jgi:hypothetical protein
MITYEALKNVNEKIKTTDIKGKQYAEVNQRINAFRMLFPNGSIETDILSLDGGVCVMKATIKDEEGKVLGTGTAYENEGSSFINKTSYIENCETSAVGRALGMVGIGIDTSVASYEEVANAINNQELQKPASKPKIATLKSLFEKYNINEEQMLAKYKKTWETLTEGEATHMLNWIKEKCEK